MGTQQMDPDLAVSGVLRFALLLFTPAYGLSFRGNGPASPQPWAGTSGRAGKRNPQGQGATPRVSLETAPAALPGAAGIVLPVTSPRWTPAPPGSYNVLFLIKRPGSPAGKCGGDSEEIFLLLLLKEKCILSRMQQPAPGDGGRAISSLYPPPASLAAEHRVIEDPEWSLATVPHLTDLCLQHIIHNFGKNPVLNRLLPEHQRKVLDRLSTDVPLAVTANLIRDEDYWKRCCTERWQVCDISNYGGSWKRMFMERHLENVVKRFIPNSTDPNQVLELIPLCKDYVRKLEVDQFLPPLQVDQKEEMDDDDTGSDFGDDEVSMHHYDIGVLITALPHLEELHLTYGMKDCGMNFEWNLFDFTHQDCCNLAVALKKCHNLKVFKLTRSKVDDNQTRLLVRNLLDHPCLVELNLSHNLIRDKGAQAVGKLINCSRLETLDLCNNQIHHEGAQALAQALAENSTLTSLNLRLNCLEDKGGEAIGHALLTNTTLKSIHLGSNNLSEPTATVFSQVLAQNTTLTNINFSCNHLGLDGGKQLLDGLANNKTLTEFDLRLAEVGQETEYLIHQIVWANREVARLGSLQNAPAKPL